MQGLALLQCYALFPALCSRSSVFISVTISVTISVKTVSVLPFHNAVL